MPLPGLRDRRLSEAYEDVRALLRDSGMGPNKSGVRKEVPCKTVAVELESEKLVRTRSLSASLLAVKVADWNCEER